MRALDRRYMLVDPENRHVAASIETQLDAARRALAHFEEHGPAPKPAAAFTEGHFDELLRVCRDFWRLWDAPTTTHRDRKEIIRTLVTHVVVDGRTEREIYLRVVWADGTPDSTVVVALHAATEDRIDELAAAGLTTGEIARRLNEQGLQTLKARPWTRAGVAASLRRRAARGH